MAHKRRIRSEPLPEELPMTPMIDVVFQLMIYFIWTIKPIDVFANLDVSRPAPDKTQKQQVKLDLVKIDVLPDGYMLLDVPVTEQSLRAQLKELADLNAKQTVLIMCAALAPHERLVKVLDLCAEFKMTNIAVVSTN